MDYDVESKIKSYAQYQTKILTLKPKLKISEYTKKANIISTYGHPNEQLATQLPKLNFEFWHAYDSFTEKYNTELFRLLYKRKTVNVIPKPTHLVVFDFLR